jgi:hypothetical protein
MTRLAVVFLHFLVFGSSSTEKIELPKSLAPLAIKAIIDEYFVANVHEIEIVSLGVKNGPAEETIDEILRLENQTIAMRISRHCLDTDQLKLNSSSILFFDSPENFNRTQGKIDFQSDIVKRHRHLIHVHNATLDDVKVVAYKNLTIDRVDFLVNKTRDSIELATAFMYSPVACNENQFEVINRFTRLQMRWESSKFFVEKYRNLHQCPMEMFTVDGATDDSIESTLVSILNSTVVPQNQSKSFAADKISFRVAHLRIDQAEYLSMYAIRIEPRKIYIPPGKLYGDYEKMLLPFDTFTWIAVVLTISPSVAFILVVKRVSLKVFRICFGSSNSSPLMNLISIVLNGSQSSNLVEDVPRIFLLIFLFWSLIFR